MSTNEQQTIYRCSRCNYFSDRKYNYTRHLDNVHNIKYQNRDKFSEGENVTPSDENVTPSGENVTPGGENVTPVFFCKKCNKKYNSKRYLTNHELKCKGVDELTCPRCMISFSNRHHKSRHIKANKCKARSIIHAREPNPQNIIHNQNIQTQNNIQNIHNNIQNNNLIINNFGNERLDHITKEDVCKMLLSGINTVPKYIEKKHFDKGFPENNNIIYTKHNKCKVLENNCWKEKDIDLLSSKLIKDNTKVMLLYCDDNEIKSSEEIQDQEIYEHIKNKLILIYNKSDHAKYNNVLYIIKELIKNSSENEIV